MTAGSTRVFAVLGDPVAHSLSPRMHGVAFRAAGLDAVYVAIRASEHEVAPLARALCAAGGGASITAPNKQAAAAAADRPSARVRELGGCNTVWGPGMAADNTDVDGVLASMRELRVTGGAWLVAGTGGAARAVSAAARELGAAIAVRSRSGRRAAAFNAWLAASGVAAARADQCTVLVNATPLGRGPTDALPLDPSLAPAAGAALDLVYARGGTPWVRVLAARGLHAIDGRTMLVAQGAAAWAHWFPGVEAPLGVMHAAVADALA